MLIKKWRFEFQKKAYGVGVLVPEGGNPYDCSVSVVAVCAEFDVPRSENLAHVWISLHDCSANDRRLGYVRPFNYDSVEFDLLVGTAELLSGKFYDKVLATLYDKPVYVSVEYQELA